MHGVHTSMDDMQCTLQPFTWIVAMFFKAKFRPTNKKEYFVAKFVINQFGIITNSATSNK